MESILNNNYSKKLLYGLTFILIILAFLTVYLFLQNQKLKSKINQQIVPTVQVPSPASIVSSISIPPDETTNWKTYTNTKFGFQVKFPIDVLIQENNKSQDFYESIAKIQLSQGSQIFLSSIHDIDLYKGTSPKVVAEREVMDSGFRYEISEKRINNYIAAYVELETKENQLVVFLTHPTKNVFITLTTNKLNKVLLDQILSTFKFLPIEENKESACIKEGGDWLAEFNECEGPTLTESFCKKQGGKFFGCESPCRNNSKSDMCIQVCTVVCKFNLINGDTPTLDSDFSKGWYWGSEDQKKSGTPSDWVYTDAGRSSCWHKAGVDCRFSPEPDNEVKCGGWDTSGETVCDCQGTITKSVCPLGAICDSGDYFCQGTCGSCCYKGAFDNPSYPKCQ